jgi:hypothetical protein
MRLLACHFFVGQSPSTGSSQLTTGIAWCQGLKAFIDSDFIDLILDKPTLSCLSYCSARQASRGWRRFAIKPMFSRVQPANQRQS